jgi:hypothetical protein
MWHYQTTHTALQPATGHHSPKGSTSPPPPKNPDSHPHPYVGSHLQVRLLLGEIPERAEFSAPGMREPLTPYFELTCAVRSGDLATFR